jgi:hypothetical protein
VSDQQRKPRPGILAGAGRRWLRGTEALPALRCLQPAAAACSSTARPLSLALLVDVLVESIESGIDRQTVPKFRSPDPAPPPSPEEPTPSPWYVSSVDLSAARPLSAALGTHRSMSMHSSTGFTRRRSSGQPRLPPLGRVSLDAPLYGTTAPPRPGTAVQNFAMGKVQALLQPLLETMFIAQPDNPMTYMAEYLGGSNVDGAKKMDSLMSELEEAKRTIAELEAKVCPLPAHVHSSSRVPALAWADMRWSRVVACGASVRPATEHTLLPRPGVA